MTHLPPRARQGALAILAALAAVLAAHLAVGLPEVLLVGLVGGLLGSLVVIGLDLLHSAGRAAERARGDEPGERPGGPR